MSLSRINFRDLLQSLIFRCLFASLTSPEAVSNCRIAPGYGKWFSAGSGLGLILWWRRALAAALRPLRESVNEDAGSMEHYGVRARHLAPTRDVDFTLTRRDSFAVWGQCYVAPAGESLISLINHVALNLTHHFEPLSSLPSDSQLSIPMISKSS